MGAQYHIMQPQTLQLETQHPGNPNHEQFDMLFM